MHAANRRGSVWALISTLVAALCFPTLVALSTSAQAAVGTVTAPVAPTLAKSTANQEPGDFVIGGFASSDNLLVSIGFVDRVGAPTFSLPIVSGLTRSYGYATWTGLTKISFTANMADANAALAAMTVSTDATPGTVNIKVSATLNPTGVAYNPSNEHFYKFVSQSGISATDAITAAASDANKYDSVRGYLATITDSDENSFITSNIQNALNIWIGASDSQTEGTWKWVTGPEAGTTLSYASWATSEPNDSDGSRGGEDHAVTNWNSADGKWNDLNALNTAQIAGYVIEYSEYSGQVFSGRAFAQVSAQINSFATAVTASVGNSQSLVSWTAPSGTITNFTATATPVGAGTPKSCTTASGSVTSCLITDLVNGTAYTFKVFTNFTTDLDSTSAPTEQVTPVDSSATITGPASFAGTAGTSALVGSFSINDPFTCGWGQMTATVSVPSGKGAFTATTAGAATISGSGTRSISITGTKAEVDSILDTVSFTPAIAGSVSITTNVVPSIRFTSGGKTYHLNKSNGHYYTVVTATANWAAANAAAQGLEYCGSKGYLAAIDNSAEQTFIEGEALTGSGDMWTSGQKVGGTWTWIPGPNAGASNNLAFYNQGGSSPWHLSQPDGSGIYHQLWFRTEVSSYGWDDVTDSSKKYLVEFGSSSAYTEPTVSTSATIAAAPVVPGAPTDTGAGLVGDDANIKVDWVAPNSDGGASITDYIIEYSSDAGANWQVASDGVSTSTTATFTNLSRTATYLFKVKAVNSVGASLYSTVSPKVRRGTKPASLELIAPTITFTPIQSATRTTAEAAMLSAKIVQPPTGIPGVEIIKDLSAATGAGLKIQEATVIESGSQAKAVIEISSALAANKVAAGFIRIGSGSWYYLGNKTLVLDSATGNYIASTDSLAFAAPTTVGSEYVLVVAVVPATFGESDVASLARVGIVRAAKIGSYTYNYIPIFTDASNISMAAITNTNISTIGDAQIQLEVTVSGAAVATSNPNSGGSGSGSSPTPTVTPSPSPTPTVSPSPSAIPKPTVKPTPKPSATSGTGSSTGSGSGSSSGTESGSSSSSAGTDGSSSEEGTSSTEGNEAESGSNSTETSAPNAEGSGSAESSIAASVTQALPWLLILAGALAIAFAIARVRRNRR